MSRRRQLERIGATPGKLALIGVLVLTLAWVVVRQLPSDDSNSSIAQATPKERRQRPSDNVQPVTKVSTLTQPLKPWPEVDFSQTIIKDPFALPSWAVAQVRETIANNNDPSVLTDLQKQGASIVVIAGEEKTARIGEKSVRIGDVLNGYQVTDITPQGVFLNKLEPR